MPLAHRGAVVADALEPDRHAARVSGLDPVDQPPATLEHRGEGRSDLLRPAQPPARADQRGVEHGVRVVELVQPAEVARLDGCAQPLGGG